MLPDNDSCDNKDELSVVSVIDICDKVKFQNVQEKYYLDLSKVHSIMVEYVIDKKVHYSTRDWLGLFPRGWTSLMDYVAFQYVDRRAFDKDEKKWRMSINLKFVKKDLYQAEFQFVYVNRCNKALGGSSFFGFCKSEPTSEVSNQSSTRKIMDRKHDSKTEPKFVTKRNTNVHNNQGYRNGWNLIRMAHSSHENPLFVLRSQFGCDHCEHYKDLFSRYNNLLIEVKTLAESKRELMDQIHLMERDFELLMAAKQKFCTLVEIERREKETYELFTKSLMQQVINYNHLQLSTGNCQILPLNFQLINDFGQYFDFTPLAYPVHVYAPYPMMIGNYNPQPQVFHAQPLYQPLGQFSSIMPTNPHRDIHHSSNSSSISRRNLNFKAIIGWQQEKIRMMSNRITELTEELEKKTAVSHGKRMKCGKALAKAQKSNLLEKAEVSDQNNN
uniref:SKICH domain-containing protein n=2 Tax=Clastoptera arizonana TaxID=38151 RepID=A0A1B6EH08_9HEMI